MVQIIQAQVGNITYPLTEGQPLPITVGEILSVSYAFNYKMPETANIKIWASLYKYSFGILDRQGQSQTKEVITLVKALDWKPYEGVIDIVVGDMLPGTYGLICELPDYDVEERIDDCLEISAPPSIWDMIGPLLVIGLMAWMIPMMKEGIS